MKKLLCYGDSNTLGYDPRDWLGGCVDRPWCALLGEAAGCQTVNCGLNGRRIPRSPRERAVLLQLLEREKPEGLLIMLGTNDILQGADPAKSARNMEILLEQTGRFPCDCLLLSPPRMALPEMEAGLEALTEGLARAAERTGIRFADCRDWKIPLAFDGIHFSEAGHACFAQRVAALLDRLHFPSSDRENQPDMGLNL